LAANITVAEMFFQAQRIAGRTYETMAVYIEVAIIYLIFSTILEYIQRRGEKKLGKYGCSSLEIYCCIVQRYGTTVCPL